MTYKPTQNSDKMKQKSGCR